MLNRLDLRGVADPIALLPRPPGDAEEPLGVVRDLIARVRSEGDGALVALTEQFDGVRPSALRVPAQALQQALERLDPTLRAAIQQAADRVEAYHRTQLHPPAEYLDGGARITSLAVPVDRVGCYVPGGSAPLASTVLMTAIPAKVAGVPSVVMCTPPNRELGAVPDAVLAAAAIAGVDELYQVGGAQAIAALAYGTESIAPVDVICGPGNRFVAVAQREVAGTVGVAAAFAGPSEVVVIADGSSSPTLAAIDLLVQAEHGPDGLAWLITWNADVADAVQAEVVRLVAAAPRRDLITATLQRSGNVVIVDDPATALAVSNVIAPEHLELQVADAEALLPLVRNAGATFVGPWSPASMGDYIAGPSHVLPTHGSARFASALTVSDFMKHHHIVRFDQASFTGLAPHVAVLADAEGLAAHADSVRVRLNGDLR